MRKKVRKSLAFLLALALVVSVMSGLGLSVSADEAQPQTEPAQTEEVKDEAVKETPKVEESTPKEGEEEEEADPDAEAVPEEKKDVKKAEGEGSGDEAPVKDTTADSNGQQKDEPQAEPAEEEQDTPVEEAVDEQALPTANAPRATMSNDIVIPEPSYEKKAEYSGQDDVYDLSLSVSGSVASQAEKSPVDIVLILDESNSMVDGKNGEKRWTNTKNAANALINALDQNKNLNVRYDIVGFEGRGNGKLSEDANTSGWKETAASAKDAIPKKLTDGGSVRGGTDYQAGIRQAINDLKSARVGAQTVVVFLSDGTPTFRLTAHEQWEGQGFFAQNNEYGNGQDDTGNHNINEAVNEIKNMNVSQFYAIGLGADFNKANSTAKNNLIKLNNAVNAAVKADDVYTTQNSSGLEAIFKAIAGRVNKIACKEVKITDTINTEHAQVVTNTDGTPTKLTITVKKADGTVETGENSLQLAATTLNKKVATLSASYQNGQLVLNFPTDYELEDGWTYTITTQVKPTQAAYEYYSDKEGSYPKTGDSNTGTHSRQPGFWSNTNAVLDYTVSGTGKHATYAQPVIQVKAGTLKITKNISGLSGLTAEQIDAMKDDMTFTIKKDNKPYKTIQLSDFDLKDGTYTYEMPYCVPGATYTVTESGMDVVDFDCATKVNGKTGTSDEATIVKGETETIAFTNDYTPSAKNLTIKKKIVGDKPTSLNAKFDFKIEGPQTASGNYTTTGGQTVSFTDGVANITINGESSITIEKLPLGPYTVTETSMGNVDHYTWTTSENAKTGDATLSAGKDGTVTITNTLMQNPKVTIKKQVTGNMYQESDTFSFKTTLTGEDSFFSLSANDTAGKVIEIPYDGGFTVTEESNSLGYKLKTITVNKTAVNISDNGYTLSNVKADTEVIFTNDKTIQPPNGIITTIAPYAIMVVLAAGAAVYFVYSRRRRNG